VVRSLKISFPTSVTLVTSLLLAVVLPNIAAAAPTSIKVSTKASAKIANKKVAVKHKAISLVSPFLTWPPKKFTVSGDIYAKVPTAIELTGIISAQTKLYTASQKCIDNACGALFVGSTQGCRWWEIDSSIYGPSLVDPTKSIEYGTLRTTALGTKPRQIAAILMISTEQLQPRVTVRNIAAKCWPTSSLEKVPNNTYLPNSNR
jgi:hypothetical protein